MLRVPLGTVARDSETGEVLAEIVTQGERATLVQGGRGGLGTRVAAPYDDYVVRRVHGRLRSVYAQALISA